LRTDHQAMPRRMAKYAAMMDQSNAVMMGWDVTSTGRPPLRNNSGSL
jgi:hypothetical protein